MSFVAFIVAFAVLSWGASPAHFWLDSGEIGAAGAELGVVHPPGVPGYAFLLRAATAIPLGSLGYRMALVSSLAGAATVAMIVAILRRRGVDGWNALGAAAWILCGWTFVRHARVVEIYAFGGLLLSIVLWGFDRAARGRKVVGRRLAAVFAAAWASWCFGDLRLALVPLVGVAFVLGWRRRSPWTRWAPPVVASASCVVVALPLSSIRDPIADWGDPETAGALWDHLMAVSIRSAYSDEILPASWAAWQHNAAAALEQLAQDLGAVGPVIVLVGLASLWVRRSGARREAAVLTWIVAVELLYAIGINPMGVAERQTALVLGPVAALVAALLIHHAVVGRAVWRWATAPIAWTVLIVPALVWSWSDATATRSWGPHAWTRRALGQLPAGALLLTQSDDLAAGVLSARVLEGARPDIVAVPAQHLYKSMPDWARSHPAAVRVWQAAAEQSSEQTRIEAAISVQAAADGEVAVEHAGDTLFRHVRFWSDRGELPLVLAGPFWGPSPAAIPLQVEQWLADMPSVEDRRRLANALASHARGVVRFEQDVPRAVAVLELSLSRIWSEHASALVTLAALYDREGRTDAAVELTRRALDLDPSRPTALSNLALYLSRDHTKIDEALQYAERAARLQPNSATMWRRLAQIRALAGDTSGARAAERKADELGGAEPLDAP